MLRIDHAFDPRQNIHMYHIRGSMHESYQRFYKWHSGRKEHYSYEDFPHDYFVYLEESDRLALHAEWADYIQPTVHSDMNLELFRDNTVPVDTNSVEHILSVILAKEITKEINSEIRKKLLS